MVSTLGTTKTRRRNVFVGRRGEGQIAGDVRGRAAAGDNQNTRNFPTPNGGCNYVPSTCFLIFLSLKRVSGSLDNSTDNRQGTTRLGKGKFPRGKGEREGK